MMQQVSHTGQALTAAGLLSQDEADSPLLTERHIDALLLEPLRSRGEIIGVLGILRDEPAAVFDETDVILAETIAGYVAAAIENTQLSQQLADAAVTEERNRIARELHDSVTQNLYTVATISDTVPDIWDTHPEETRKALNNLRRLSRGALAEMRILLLELRPSSLLEKSLGQLLQQLGEGIEGRSRIQATTSIVSDQIFPDDVQVALYRIAQEALNNVIKHSEATQATIGLYHVPDQVTLSVRDNGHGFDMQTMEYGGFGLENMQERARQINAKLDIKSELKKGTEITVIWQPQDQENE
jgi:two-component system nitrate/nitrite sensor histidine kinase NarX